MIRALYLLWTICFTLALGIGMLVGAALLAERCFGLEWGTALAAVAAAMGVVFWAVGRKWRRK